MYYVGISMYYVANMESDMVSVAYRFEEFGILRNKKTNCAEILKNQYDKTGWDTSADRYGLNLNCLKESMSDIIKLLPDSVANQIAAGEVIQRPASVVKELVENAIDAGASKIHVIVIDAGKSLIQVIDNGKGMSGTDARLAFERHATSKISEAADLFALQTMGFRGEALASIASVAQVELRTRMSDDELGTGILIEGGKVREQLTITCPVGANFAVRNLFFNIPARRKFLKSNHTEMSNILAEFERMALAHPDVDFILHSGDTPLMELHAGNFKQRIVGIFGKKIDTQLIPVEVETTLAHIYGFVGTPQAARKKGAHQFFFVNGRYMRHPYFAKAVMAAYERLIPDGEQIPYFLCFEVNPSHIDVNIHPAKTEIKFQDEQALWPILLAAVRESLGKFNAVPTIDFDTADRPTIPSFVPGNTDINPPQIHINKAFNPFEKTEGQQSNPPAAFPNKPSRKSSNGWQNVYNAVFNSAEAENPCSQPSLYDTLPAEERDSWEKANAQCFQFRGRFIITTTTDGLLFVDQHRAHVRILYDMYRRQLTGRQGLAQGMLFPQILQLPPSSATIFEMMADSLSFVGFDFSPLGGGSYSILGIPSGTEGLDPVSLLQSIVDDAISGQIQPGEQVEYTIALSLARRAAMPVGQALEQEEMAHLLEKLFQSSNPNYSPDGNVIQTTVRNEKIEGLFDGKR